MLRLVQISFELHDIPGLDKRTYKGDELALVMHGVMPTSVEFHEKSIFYADIEGCRSLDTEEKLRQAHVVAFFIPQGAVIDSDQMSTLATVYTEITVRHGT